MTMAKDQGVKEVDPRDLRRRSRRSFAVFGVLAALLVSLFAWAWTGSRESGVPEALRSVLELNGRIWNGLFSPDRVTVARKLPPRGTRPRFNGDLGLEKPVDLAHWQMTVEAQDADGAVIGKPLELNMAALRALPRTDTSTRFKCIEGWSEDISYAGVRFSDFLRAYRLGTRSGADWDPAHPPTDLYRYVGLETPDGEYYVSIDMDSMLHPQTLLAYEMNEAPLDAPSGAPLRLIIPVKYGIKHLKRIGKIVFSDTRPPDYWAEQGYDWFAGL
jgi:hypothetical protein